MLLKSCTQYAGKFGKLSSSHRTEKGQFAFQSERKAMPKDAQTTAQLHSSHTPVKECSKFSKPGFNTIWTENFQIFKLDLEKAEEPEIKRTGTLKDKQNNPQDKKCYNQGENKEFIPKTCKQPMLFNNKSGGGQRSKWIFLPRTHPGGYKAHEKMLTLLIIKEIKIKTTRTYHLTQLRMAYVLRFTNKTQRGRGDTGSPLHRCWQRKLSPVRTDWEALP